MADQSISEEQKQALVRIYLSFRREYEDERGEQEAPARPQPPRRPGAGAAPARRPAEPPARPTTPPAVARASA